jgi:glyoxylase-like metal-dependent hydrolase (beta-lactamase superfamily II)
MRPTWRERKQAVADDYTIRKIGDGVYIREGVDNCVWADLGGGTAVIDTLEDPALATVIESAVAETVGKPVRWIINTHWDEDHIAGNPSFAQKGVTIIAHESAAAPTEHRDGEPDVTYQDHYILEGEGRQARIEWLGGTHTSADSIVYLPWARVLHVADLFGWGLFMQREDSPQKTARTQEILDRILSYDADVIVCGHGPTLTMDHIRRYRSYFNEMWEKVPSLAAQGKSLEQIQAEIPVPEDMKGWWRLQDWKHNRNLERIVQSL